MGKREEIIKELEDYEPYAMEFSILSVKGGLIMDILQFLREQSGSSTQALDSLSEAELNEPMKHFED